MVRRVHPTETEWRDKVNIETPAKSPFVILSGAKDLELPVLMRFFGRFAPSE